MLLKAPILRVQAQSPSRRDRHACRSASSHRVNWALAAEIKTMSARVPRQPHEAYLDVLCCIRYGTGCFRSLNGCQAPVRTPKLARRRRGFTEIEGDSARRRVHLAVVVRRILRSDKVTQAQGERQDMRGGQSAEKRERRRLSGSSHTALAKFSHGMCVSHASPYR